MEEFDGKLTTLIIMNSKDGILYPSDICVACCSVASSQNCRQKHQEGHVIYPSIISPFWESKMSWRQKQTCPQLFNGGIIPLKHVQESFPFNFSFLLLIKSNHGKSLDTDFLLGPLCFFHRLQSFIQNQTDG